MRTAKHPEQNYAIGLIDQAKAHGFAVRTAIMDKGYDVTMVHNWCIERDFVPIIALRESGPVKRGAAEPPHCAHGSWEFGGADYKRKPTKWRCPTGECEAKSMWIKASRLRPLIPHGRKRHRDLYRSRVSKVSPATSNTSGHCSRFASGHSPGSGFMPT